jgi:2,5-diketo-D-gluconate reductase A
MPALTIPSVTLHDGIEIPQLGLGVFQMPPEETQSVVEHALDVGYRPHRYRPSDRNEVAVGVALAASDLPREEVFVTAWLWNARQGGDSTLKAFEATLGRLGFEYVDLFLIHWPVLSENRALDTWRASERILEEARAHDRRLERPDRGLGTAGGGSRHAADGQSGRAAFVSAAGRAA